MRNPFSSYVARTALHVTGVQVPEHIKYTLVSYFIIIIMIMSLTIQWMDLRAENKLWRFGRVYNLD